MCLLKYKRHVCIYEQCRLYRNASVELELAILSELSQDVTHLCIIVLPPPSQKGRCNRTTGFFLLYVEYLLSTM